MNDWSVFALWAGFFLGMWFGYGLGARSAATENAQLKREVTLGEARLYDAHTSNDSTGCWYLKHRGQVDKGCPSCQRMAARLKSRSP